MNTIFREDVYFDELQKFYADLRQAALAAAVLAHLDLRHVPRGTVIYSSPVKKYTAKDGSVTEYQYTNPFLYINCKKYYVSKKHPYPSGLQGRDLNNPDDPDNHLILMERLKLRMDAKAALKFYTCSARSRCRFLNAVKSKQIPRILFKRALAEASSDFSASDEHTRLAAALDHLLGCGPDARLSAQFRSEIFNDCGERQFSKNEVIAARCIHDCGISYDLEPAYPGSPWRADFRLHAGGRSTWLEIAGLRADPAYEDRLRQKRRLAQKLGIPLVVIDMTDYPDENGRPRTRLDYGKLRRILLKISLGALPDAIVTPY